MTTPASKNPSRRRVLAALAALPALPGLHGVTSAQAQAQTMQQNPVTAIDIALEPDATMVQHAKAANARLLRDFPKGFALDATHHPHLSMLQQFVRTADLDKVYAAAGRRSGKGKAGWMATDGDQVLLHPQPADRPCRHCRRTD